VEATCFCSSEDKTFEAFSMKVNFLFLDYFSQLEQKDLYKNGKLVKKLPLNESKKLFIPRRVDERYNDLLRSMITTNTDIGSYLKRRDSYKDLSKSLDPLVMGLPKNDLTTFVKANPFWLDSLDKVKYLLNTLNYKENRDIAEHHIGQILSGGQGFFTTPELKYYENKFAIPKSNYGKIDTYVFVGSDEFKETRKGSYKKVFDIERLMKVSVDDWKDTRDYGIGATIKMMRLRAGANNKQLFKKFENKIIHVIVEDFPYVFPNINIKRNEQWKNEFFQRNCISQGLDKIKDKLFY
jgi:hypothetical protein